MSSNDKHLYSGIIGWIGLTLGFLGVLAVVLFFVFNYGSTQKNVIAPELKEVEHEGDKAWPELKTILTNLRCQLPSVPDPISSCLTRVSDEPMIFIVGDSHASNLIFSINNAIKGTKWQAGFLGDRGLGPQELNMKANYIASQTKPGDIVMFTMWRDRIYENISFDGESRNGRESFERLYELNNSLISFRDKIISTGATFVLIDDLPYLCTPEKFKEYLYEEKLSKCRVKAAISRDDRAPLTEVLESVASGGAVYLDPHDILCESDTCWPFKEGTPLYGDGAGNFSTFHSSPLKFFFSEWLKSQ